MPPGSSSAAMASIFVPLVLLVSIGTASAAASLSPGSLKYNTDGSICGIALRISGTVIPEVVTGMEFWLLLIINIAVRTLRALDLFKPEEYGVALPFGLTGVTGSLMTFFVCFYNGQQFTRYNHLYATTQAMFEHTMEFASMLRVQVPNQAVRRKASKLLLASCLTFFFARTDSISRIEWKQLYRLELITIEEINHLRKHVRHLEDDAIPAIVLLQWAGELVFKHTENTPDREDMLAGFFGKLYHVCRCQTEIVNIMELPMPFQYFHIMNMMLMLNLVLWGYALGCQDSHFAPLIFMFVQMMFQGLRELSTSLADPFGDDIVDFPLHSWMSSTYSRIHCIIEDEYDNSHLRNADCAAFLDPARVSALMNVNTDYGQ
mmetsp:Transcript_61015/g.170679  ORF Transcript_61015/g.170679 Transcript_61015/m.170679 type:complete len:376 (-) Transcript_61015:188-1315(-)